MSDKYVMDYISDKNLFKAVMFARKMIREGTSPSIANTRAAKYYDVSTSAVAHYTGQTGGRTAGNRKGKRASLDQDRRAYNRHTHVVRKGRDS